MKLAYLTLAAAIATAGCATERAVAPSAAGASTAWGVSSQNTQVPLLYVVDGVRLQRDQVPTLTADQVLSVSVMKGHLALQKFGPDAAYGVVLIRTRAGNVPQT
jgi:hypothetical protein